MEHRGLKQGDPLIPFLFILIMESLYLSFNCAVEAGIFTGLQIDDALTISHLFYADDAIFIGEWSKENLKVFTDSFYRVSFNMEFYNQRFNYHQVQGIDVFSFPIARLGLVMVSLSVFWKDFGSLIATLYQVLFPASVGFRYSEKIYRIP
ncbi:RNA-directed DNA polymerase, eukaryota [Tanacetum coccineum]